MRPAGERRYCGATSNRRAGAWLLPNVTPSQASFKDTQAVPLLGSHLGKRERLGGHCGCDGQHGPSADWQRLQHQACSTQPNMQSRAREPMRARAGTIQRYGCTH